MIKKIILISFICGFEFYPHKIFPAETVGSKPSSETPIFDKETGGENAGEKKTDESQKRQVDVDNYYFKNSVFKLAPFSIPIFTTQDVVSTVQIEASMETTDKEWVEIRTKIPILYHHLFVDLYHSLNFLWDRLTPPSTEVLKKRFMMVANRVLGEGKIKKVFIILVAVSDR